MISTEHVILMTIFVTLLGTGYSIRLLGPIHLWIFSSVLLAFSPIVNAKKIVIVIGSGEAKSTPVHFAAFDSFVSEIQAVQKAQSALQFEMTSLFGAEDRANELAPILGKNFSPLTAGNLQEKIDDLISQVENGSLTSKDQVLIHIISHGFPQKAGEVGHSIADGLMDDSILSLAPLIKLRDAFENKNVKLALIDGSCFSGALLDFASDKTCVITSTNRFMPAGPGFSSTFWEIASQKNKSNLEDLFLETREKSGFPYDLPEISTQTHLKIQNFWDFIYTTKMNERLTGAEPALEKFRYETIEEIKNLLESSSEFSKIIVGNLNLQLRTLISEYFKIKSQISQETFRLNELKAGEFHFPQNTAIGNPVDWSYLLLLCNKKENTFDFCDDPKVMERTTEYDEINARIKSLEERARNIYLRLDSDRLYYSKAYQGVRQVLSKPNPCQDFTL